MLRRVMTRILFYSALVTVIHVHGRAQLTVRSASTRQPFVSLQGTSVSNSESEADMRPPKIAVLLGVIGIAAGMRADDARFDLPGPKIDVYVTRGATTLPIAMVPSLLPRDTLRVKADLPATQSNHLL